MALGNLNMQAQAFNVSFIGTAHLVLAILHTGAATRMLGCNHRMYRAAVETLALSELDLVTVPVLPFTPRLRRVLRDAVAASQIDLRGQAGTLQLLVAVLQDIDNTAVQALTRLGKDVPQLQSTMSRAVNDGVLESP